MKVLHLQHILFFYRLFTVVVVLGTLGTIAGLGYKWLGSSIQGFKAKLIYIGIIAVLLGLVSWGVYLLVALRG